MPPSACRFGQTGSGKTYTMKSLEGTPGHSQSKARPGHSFVFHPQTHDVSATPCATQWPQMLLRDRCAGWQRVWRTSSTRVCHEVAVSTYRSSSSQVHSCSGAAIACHAAVPVRRLQRCGVARLTC